MGGGEGFGRLNDAIVPEIYRKTSCMKQQHPCMYSCLYEAEKRIQLSKIVPVLFKKKTFFSYTHTAGFAMLCALRSHVQLEIR